jgi:hypothetical protein
MTVIAGSELIRLRKPKLISKRTASNRGRALVLTACSIAAAMQTIGQSCAAQGPAPCTTPVALGAMSYGAIPRVGAPYSATVMTTQDQTQSDGTVVHGSVTTYQARDAAGRMWERRSLGCQPGPNGELHPILQILVTDPETRTTISWTVDDPAKVYRVVHEPARTRKRPNAVLWRRWGFTLRISEARASLE